MTTIATIMAVSHHNVLVACGSLEVILSKRELAGRESWDWLN